MNVGSESRGARAWRWLREHAVMIVGVLVVIYLLVPIAVIFVFSFNDPAGRYNFTWVGFTFSHWSNAFGIPELNDALVTSLKLALLATVIATAIGTLMALALVRHQFLGRRFANFLIVIPMATPEVVIGSALLSFFLILGSPALGFQTLLIAHVMFCISFVVVVVRSRLIGFDRRLEEAARDLGADSFTTFRLVTLPLIAPGIFGGAMLAFALSIDDFVISNFNSGTTVTFPLYIFGAAQRGIPVEVNVIAMILFFTTSAAMGFTTWQQRRAEKMSSVRPDQEEVAPVLSVGQPAEPRGTQSERFPRWSAKSGSMRTRSGPRSGRSREPEVATDMTCARPSPCTAAGDQAFSPEPQRVALPAAAGDRQPGRCAGEAPEPKGGTGGWPPRGRRSLGPGCWSRAAASR